MNIAGIINQTYPSDLVETIVADDGSSDGVEDLIKIMDHFESKYG